MKNQQHTNAPRTVIRGESISSPFNDEIAFLDWLAFTVKDFDLGKLRKDLINVFNLKNLDWVETQKGWAGYTDRIELGEYGWISYGGQSQQDTINIQLRPIACRQINDKERIIKWAHHYGAKITRCDIAHDDFNGETVNIEQARKWHEEDGYTLNGRKPQPREIINYDKTVGDTFYIGKRSNGKMLRIYEKGKEQGDISSQWCRVEVEFRSKDRVIPWKIITETDRYLAGSYPCLSHLSQKQSVIKTVKNSFQISYERNLEWAQRAVGRSINAILIKEEGNIEKAITLLQRDGLPKRLKPFTDIIFKYDQQITTIETM